MSILRSPRTGKRRLVTVEQRIERTLYHRHAALRTLYAEILQFSYCFQFSSYYFAAALPRHYPCNGGRLAKGGAASKWEKFVVAVSHFGPSLQLPPKSRVRPCAAE